MTTIRLFDTYSHIDGTPGRGHVYVRPVVSFTDGTRTVLDSWASYELDAQGRLDATITWADNTDPSPVWLQVWESVDCARGHVWDVGPQLLTDGANLNLGALRELPAAHVSPPRYQVAPAGPAGPPGPAGPAGADSTVPGPPGPPGKDGSGVTIVGIVPTAADLPATSTPGDMYIAVDTGNGWTWDGSQWIDVGPIRGPQGDPGPAGPAGPAGQNGADAQLPAGSPGQILEYQGSSWQASDNLMSTMSRVVGAESQINDIVGQTPLPWDPAVDYPEFSIVMHNGDLWGALRATNAGEEPGVDPKWVDADLGGLLQRSKHWRVGPPADPADDGKVLVAGGGDATWQDPPAGYDDTALAGRVTAVETGKADAADVTALQTAVQANTQAIANVAVMPHWTGTQAEYDAIAQPDPGTVYLITT